MIRKISPTQDDALPLFGFLVSQMRNAAVTPVDEARSTRNFWHVVSSGTVYVAEIGDKIVGTLAFSSHPLTWYGPQEMVGYFDEWLVVDPRHRGVGKALMQHAAEDESMAGVPIFIRRVRRAVDRGIVSDILGINVVGNIIRLR